jgi:hypothetical protein
MGTDKGQTEPTHEPTPFQRFTDFARCIVVVPKSEIDEKLVAEKAKKQANKPTAKSA